MPLAEMVVAVDERALQKLNSALQQFCDAEHLIIDASAVLPRQRRTVFQAKIKISDESFFYGDNFSNATKFSLRAYSHENEQIWKPRWARLTAKLIDVLGRDKVREQN